MPNERDALDQLLRLIAIEILLAEMLTSRYLASDDPVATARAHRQHMRTVLSAVAVPGLGNAAEFCIGCWRDWR